MRVPLGIGIAEFAFDFVDADTLRSVEVEGNDQWGYGRLQLESAGLTKMVRRQSERPAGTGNKVFVWT